MAAITLHDVRKSYGSTAVIHGLDATIADGEFVVVVGPSGCGKSTLLRMIAGLEDVTAGTITIGARVVNDLEPKDRDIAMVFQNYALYPHMSVFDNIAYGLRIRGQPSSVITQKVNAAAAMLELTGLLQRTPRELSGGQRQRVAMGRAIVRDPAVFLFDEPLSNLDARLRVQMRLEIARLHRSFQRTSVFVTHDQVEAMTLGQRLMVMNAGRIEQFGTPMDVYDQPASIFVATFMGSPSMNLIHPAALSGWPCPPQWMRVGVRPEHILLAAQSSDDLPIAARVDMVEALGADTLVHCQVAEQPWVVRVPGFAQYAPGADLTCYVPRHRLYGFDAEGQRCAP
jgi:sn-glycerol 3-phosphate transport system ATP-binding protein